MTDEGVNNRGKKVPTKKSPPAKSFGGQSMVAPLRRVIVKRPREAFRNSGEIMAQWKDLAYTGPPNLEKAEEEFARLVSILRDNGTEVLFLPEDDRTGLDSLYTHDPALVTDAGVILFQTGKKARRGEGPAMGDALKNWGIPVYGVVAGGATTEGGDMIWVDRKTLLVGRSFRTNSAGVEALKPLLKPLGAEVIAFDLAYWSGPGDVLHLMSFISLLDQDLAVVYRRLMPVALYECLQARNIELVDIPEEEFPTQGCNILALAPRKLVMLAGNPITKTRLEKAGCTVFEIEGREIALKGSGGPTCLTRPLLREALVKERS
jgi:N-dimethylarginine dimethylaminohydrolase